MLASGPKLSSQSAVGVEWDFPPFYYIRSYRQARMPNKPTGLLRIVTHRILLFI